MVELQLMVAGGDASLSVRHVTIEASLHQPFMATVTAMSPHHDLALDAIIGAPASLMLSSPVAGPGGGPRHYHGICTRAEQTHPEATGLASYRFHIEPKLALLRYRRNYRVFQHRRVLDIAAELLAEAAVEYLVHADPTHHPTLEYRVQYAEDDLAFLTRLLSREGLTYRFEHTPAGSLLILDDAPQARPERIPPIRYVDVPTDAAPLEFVRDVRLLHQLRPSSYRIHSFDERREPGFTHQVSRLAQGSGLQLERFHYLPGAFIAEAKEQTTTPVADGQGVARMRQARADQLAAIGLQRARADSRAVTFQTNAMDVSPGCVFRIADHPRPDIAVQPLLVTQLRIEAGHDIPLEVRGQAVFASAPYRPPLSDPGPRAQSVETAVVVGPKDEDIHCDELGRVRVRFPWDRASPEHDRSSCWLRVSQGWAGAGFGLLALPRVGHEVLVGFIGGDPDQPIIVGRVHGGARPVPYPLPEHKTVSTWRSQSSPDGDGFNELRFDDKSGAERVYLQAERNLDKLVKEDETQRIGRHRTVRVGANLTSHVEGDRNERIARNREAIVEGSAARGVHGDLHSEIGGAYRRTVRADAHRVTDGAALDRVQGDHHAIVRGEQRLLVAGKRSDTVEGDAHRRVGGDLAIEVGGEIHLKAGSKLVLEADAQISLVGPGGFIDISNAGVAISGTLVRINSGGSAAQGCGASVDEPEQAGEATVVQDDTTTAAHDDATQDDGAP